MDKRKYYLVVPFLSILLNACGGNSSIGSPTFNGAPGITSSDSQTFPENSTEVAHKATASDPDGDVLTWSISGGDDAKLLSIDKNSGEISFKNPPDFESPQDTNKDNEYQLSISVTDGTSTKNQALVIQITDQNDANLAADKEVEMRNFSSGDHSKQNVFEADYIKMEPGEVLEFVTVNTSHNSVTELTPNDAAGWQIGFTGGKVKLQQEGIYIYYCEPHRSLGMWGIVQVGDAKVNKTEAIAKVEAIIKEIPSAVALRAAIGKVE